MYPGPNTVDSLKSKGVSNSIWAFENIYRSFVNNNIIYPCANTMNNSTQVVAWILHYRSEIRSSKLRCSLLITWHALRDRLTQICDVHYGVSDTMDCLTQKTIRTLFQRSRKRDSKPHSHRLAVNLSTQKRQKMEMMQNTRIGQSVNLRIHAPYIRTCKCARWDWKETMGNEFSLGELTNSRTFKWP